MEIGKKASSKTIYLAGGCFWGVEGYISSLDGVLSTKVGYANGNVPDPTYEKVSSGNTGFAETVEVKYDPSIISTKELLNHFFKIIDPTALNRQGNDIGTQYRSGIYYKDENGESDKKEIEDVIKKEQEKHNAPVVVEVEPLENFYEAEGYHQKYLEKNPRGYCHIDLSDVKKYKKPSDEILKQKLSEEQYNVTQKNATEAPHSNPYDKNFKEGIYIDVATGEPLFSSSDKFDSGSGWPSFSKALKNEAVKEREDFSHGINRVEVRSNFGNSHLGHLFNDGPPELGGKRYCINGAALRFIPKNNMEQEGYGEFLKMI